MRSILDLIQSLNETADLSAQRDTFLRSVSEFGYDTLIFGMIADPTQSVPAEEMFWIDIVPKGWMQQYEANNYAISGAFGEEAQAIFTTLESNFAYTLQELGAATVDPSSLGIEAP